MTLITSFASSALHCVYGLPLFVCCCCLAVVFYRVRLHPLAQYPGPIWAKISGFRAVYHAFIGDLQLDMLECHRKYDIYSRGTNVKKSTAYRAFETTPTAHDLQSTVDKTAHMRKRRVMSQAFSDVALKDLEEHVLRHIEVFIGCLADQVSSHDIPEKDSWSSPKNIAHWCSYLSFDFMDELWGESTLLTVAGSDAISTGMAGCFYYLSRHNDAYERACKEVRSAFASSIEIRSGPALSSCVFLRACIEESLRMSPPVGGALWREVENGGLYIGDRLVPKGCDVGVGIYAIQHDEKYFVAPFDYSPERWIMSGKNPPDAVARAKSAFSAFSIGPVGCLGKNLAYMELTLTMAWVLWALDFRLAQDNSASKPKETYLSLYPEHSNNEYHLRDRFTSWKDGPMLEFRSRHTTPI